MNLSNYYNKNIIFKMQLTDLFFKKLVSQNLKLVTVLNQQINYTHTHFHLIYKLNIVQKEHTTFNIFNVRKFGEVVKFVM